MSEISRPLRSVTESYPNGMEARRTYDEAGNTTDLAYVKTTNCTSACIWLDFQANYSIHGQQLVQASSLSTQNSTLDKAGRLTSVQDTPAGTGCTIRTYAYDADSNRTSLTAQAPATDGSCNTGATGTTTSHTYDAADRITDTGFTYDSFGNITTVPATVTGTITTATYYANNKVHSLIQGTTTRTWTLDPAWRLRVSSDSGGSTSTKTYHYGSGSDAPTWIAEDATATHWTRNIFGTSGEFAAVTDSVSGTALQLTNLHNDVVTTASLDPTVTAPLSTFEATEFGQPRASTSPRYGWLGGALRETDSLTGILLMGARLYVPVLGRFLQVDPVDGGSANRYDYATQDPINYVDTTGTICWLRCAYWSRSGWCSYHYWDHYRAWGYLPFQKYLGNNWWVVVCAAPWCIWFVAGRVWSFRSHYWYYTWYHKPVGLWGWEVHKWQVNYMVDRSRWEYKMCTTAGPYGPFCEGTSLACESTNLLHVWITQIY